MMSEAVIPGSDFGSISWRGMTTSLDRLEAMQDVATQLNTAAGQELYQIELHAQQTDFLNQQLAADRVRIIIRGNYLQQVGHSLSPFWRAMEAADERAAEAS